MPTYSSYHTQAKNLPIEANCHYNKELWAAPAEQLAGYAADENAFGYGLYLVFWFGLEFPLPNRADGKAAPASASDLEEILNADLDSPMDGKISIVVIDVAHPQAP